MVVRDAALLAVGDLATEQWGLVTTAQARAAGLRAPQLTRLVAAEVLERLRHGVYRVAGAPPHRFDDLRAAWLSLDPVRTADERLAGAAMAVVSHRSSALVHELGDLDADRLDFTTQTRRQSRDRQVRFHRRQFDDEEWTVVDGLPVMTVLVTIRDLAAGHLDGDHLAGVVRDAVTAHRVDVDDLAEALSPYAHRYGVALGQGDMLLRQLLEVAGLPARAVSAGRLVDSIVTQQSLRNLMAHKGRLAGAPVSDALITYYQSNNEPLRRLLAEAGALGLEPVIRALATDPLRRMLWESGAFALEPTLRHLAVQSEQPLLRSEAEAAETPEVG